MTEIEQLQAQIKDYEKDLYELQHRISIAKQNLAYLQRENEDKIQTKLEL